MNVFGPFRWKRLLLPASLIALFLGAPGCMRSHTIEPGTWRLSIRAVESNAGMAGRTIKPKEVQVSLGWGKDKDDKNQEQVHVRYFKPDSDDVGESGQRVLSGAIRQVEDNAGKKLSKIEIAGVDDYWQLSYTGDVMSARRMSGTVWARGRVDDSYYFSGVWKMEKVLPRPADAAQSAGKEGGAGP